MKQLLTAFILALSLTVYASPKDRVTTPASDPRVVFVGRTLVAGDDVTFDWSGVYARISFTGEYLAMRVSDTKKNYYNLWIDKDACAEPDRVFTTFGSDSLIVLFDMPRSKGAHSVILQKRTEAEQGKTTVHSFISQGPLMQAEPLRPRLLEFVGDSYTCGYGSENSVRSDPFKPETENCSKTYASIISRYFGADYITAAHSGQGIARNYDDFGRGWSMPDRYGCVFDCDKEGGEWKGGGYKPDMTVIFLGTNDFSTGRQPTLGEFKAGYIRLLQGIKANYGEDHKILCFASAANPLLKDYVQAVVESCGMKNVWYSALYDKALNIETDLGASWHPSYPGHLKWAHAMLPYISSITGWPMEDKVLK